VSAREDAVRGIVAAFDRQQPDEVLPFLSEDVLWEEDPDWPGGTTWRGHDGARESMTRLFESMDFDTQLEEAVQSGDKALARLHWRGHGITSGASIDMRVAIVFSFEGDLIAGMRFFLDPARASIPGNREQLARESIAAFNERGPEGLRPFLADDVLWEDDPAWPDSESWRGADAALAALAERLETTQIGAEVEGVVERGDRMLLLQHWSARGSESGAPADMHVGSVNTMRGDVTEHVKFFLDQERARAAFRELMVRDAVAAFDHGGAESMLPYLTADVVWREDPDWPGGSTYAGHDGVRDALGRLLESMDFESEVEELVQHGDKVLVAMHWTAQGSASGAEVDQRASVVFTLEDELIARVEFFFDPERARAALEAE
jgi:ketosteroid isomerase-like protein